jgi:hypothetical protein
LLTLLLLVACGTGATATTTSNITTAPLDNDGRSRYDQRPHLPTTVAGGARTPIATVTRTPGLAGQATVAGAQLRSAPPLM